MYLATGQLVHAALVVADLNLPAWHALHVYPLLPPEQLPPR
jgi:hypothetical protein